MYKNPFKLNSVLASDSPANPYDTLATKKKMNEFGVMEIPSYGLDDMPDKPLFDGIRAFQQANNLKVDGIMKPGGETEKAIQQKDRVAYKTSAKKPVPPKVPSQPQYPRTPMRAQPYPYPEAPSPDKGPIQAPIASPIKGVPAKPVSPKPAPKIPSNDSEVVLRAAEGERLLQRLKTLAEKDHTIVSVFLGFAGSIGIGKENRPEDIKRAREFLDKYFAVKGEDRDVQALKSGEADPDFLFDIQRYQKENGLKVDGIIHPGGETEKSMKSHPQENNNSDEAKKDKLSICEQLQIDWQDVLKEWDRLDRELNDISYRFGQLSNRFDADYYKDLADEAKEIIRDADNVKNSPKEIFITSLSGFLSKINNITFYDRVARDIKELFIPFDEDVDRFIADLDYFYEQEERVKQEIQKNACNIKV